MPVKIKVIGRYLVTAQALANGQVVTMNDFNEVRGDIAALPSGAITQREQAIGKVLRFSISAGQILRAEHLTSQVLVRQNQSVRVMVAGPGFKASTEGKALNNGSEGQSIQVRTASGSTVSGIVQADGSIIVPYGK